MKVYVTKNALTLGIREVDCEVRGDMAVACSLSFGLIAASLVLG